MKITSVFAIFVLTAMYAHSQNLIGYNDREIRKYMKENRREMSFENVTNDKFKYLKYTDSFDSQTLLFFFNLDSVCKSERMICDFSIKAEKVKEFNTIYKKTGENRWIDERDGKNYLIEIKDEKWSCVINIEPDK
ncbi:MAG: hypothetical protein NTV31_11425 [Bacteroidia bacterium]|nr:hypothetical protein [Bacteroidia bacterium]